MFPSIDQRPSSKEQQKFPRSDYAEMTFAASPITRGEDRTPKEFEQDPRNQKDKIGMWLPNHHGQQTLQAVGSISSKNLLNKARTSEEEGYEEEKYQGKSLVPNQKFAKKPRNMSSDPRAPVSAKEPIVNHLSSRGDSTRANSVYSSESNISFK